MNPDRQRRLAAQKEFKKPITPFKQIDLSKAENVPNGMTRAFKNTRYTVIDYDEAPTNVGNAICAIVQKHDDTPIFNHWKELYKIKNEIFGKETTAVEYYPAESQLIGDHNIYWLWIFKDGEIPIPKVK